MSSFFYDIHLKHLEKWSYYSCSHFGKYSKIFVVHPKGRFNFHITWDDCILIMDPVVDRVIEVRLKSPIWQIIHTVYFNPIAIKLGRWFIG